MSQPGRQWLRWLSNLREVWLMGWQSIRFMTRILVIFMKDSLLWKNKGLTSGVKTWFYLVKNQFFAFDKAKLTVAGSISHKFWQWVRLLFAHMPSNPVSIKAATKPNVCEWPFMQWDLVKVLRKSTYTEK